MKEVSVHELKNMLESKAPHVKEIKRGIPSDVDEIISHKTIPDNNLTRV